MLSQSSAFFLILIQPKTKQKKQKKKVEWKLANKIGLGAVLCLSMFMVMIDGGLIIHGQHLGYTLRENPTSFQRIGTVALSIKPL